MNRALKYLLFMFVFYGQLHAQYITEILEYVPAPSQYMNAAPWGTPSSPGSVIGGINGSLSLGSFGGYVVFGFGQPVENHAGNPYGVDFTLFGNPMPDWSEPGIVSVMKDENGNGLPDDTWYELAGSDYFFSSTVRGYGVTYVNPGKDSAVDVPWSDNLGNSGVIPANSYYTQPYYPLPDSFPAINQEQYTLTGTMIGSAVDEHNLANITSVKRRFGYADNQFRGSAPHTLPDNPYTPGVENAGGDAFDISWAVNDAGVYVDLDVIHFIKVHTGVLDGAGWLGHVSTEITGAALVEPNPALADPEDILVIKDVPSLLASSSYHLEVAAFIDGRYTPDAQVTWSSSLPGAAVDEYNVLHLTASGELTLTARLVSNPEVSESVTTTVDLGVSTGTMRNTGFTIYPNPASDFILLQGVEPMMIIIYDSRGKIIIQENDPGTGRKLDISMLPRGLYYLKIITPGGPVTEKLIKY